MSLRRFEQHLQCAEDVIPGMIFKSELCRLQSFNCDTYRAMPFPIKLARLGLYHTNDNRAKCVFCHQETDFSAYHKYDVDTRDVHLQICAFVTGDDVIAGNIPVRGREQEDTTDEIFKDIRSKAQLYTSRTGITGQDIIEDYQIVNSSSSTKHLAPKGILGEIFPVERMEREDLESLSTENQKDVELCLFKAGTVASPDSTYYQLLHARIKAFAECEHSGLSYEDANALAEAGFYPLTEPGSCKCFHCGVTLHLQEMDIPWIEHARWSPYCQHTIEVFGIRRVTKVVQDTRKAARTFAGRRPLMDAEMIQAVSEVTGQSKDDLISGATRFFIDSRGRFPNAERLMTYSQH